MNCRTLTIRFANPLRPHEVPLLCGAVINSLNGKTAGTIFAMFISSIPAYI